MTNKKTWLIGFLVLVIVVLSGFMVYAFVITPALTGYVIDRQNEGVQIAVNQIVAQVQQNGFVQIPLGEDQTLFLAPFDPQQAQAPQAPLA